MWRDVRPRRRRGIRLYIRILNPILQSDTTPGAITDQVFEPLVAGDPETGAPTGVDRVTVEAYDNYWNGRPKIDRFVFRP